MERRVTIMYPNDAAAAQKTQRHYSVLGASLLLSTAGLTWIYTTSPSKNGLSPIYSLQKMIWVLLVASSMGPVILLTCWLYAATYSYAHKTLAKTSYSQVQVLQRRVLISCIIMSSTLAVLYTPEVVFQITNLVVELDDYNFHFWSRMTVFIMSWDVLVTPGLVLYFRRDIRITLVEMLKKMVEVNRSDGGSGSNPTVDSEISTIKSDEITIEAINDFSKPRQQSGFHVITVRS
ncbi:hypothetical protein BDR26DRAFT_871803 [Obelidium mucronatum]|nr:hypothetical protein BDR26DRAFT_871803 [Obelidium mucronatum]